MHRFLSDGVARNADRQSDRSDKAFDHGSLSHTLLGRPPIWVSKGLNLGLAILLPIAFAVAAAKLGQVEPDATRSGRQARRDHLGDGDRGALVLQAEINAILAAAATEPDDARNAMGAVNWGDLGCVEIEMRRSLLRSDEPSWVVAIVEEESPDAAGLKALYSRAPAWSPRPSDRGANDNQPGLGARYTTCGSGGAQFERDHDR